MATDTYFSSLEGTLLDDLVDKSLLSEQEAMRTEADRMTLVYQDCLFEKKALCPIDTKRWILSNRITSLPYGLWRIQAYKNFISNEISSELAEERALSIKLSKKYQNENQAEKLLAHAEKNVIHAKKEVILSYYQFGKADAEKLKELLKIPTPLCTAQNKIVADIKKLLPSNTSINVIKKRIATA
ncbi:hypothetical protein C2G38_2221691 [Gigaspora rosea]|uniref:Uncharacterized protein n=1 Tax=Gigaspora rosea TaxID=44941 RepID=A0A397U380_9GLOM|nr:hypothetical protein C2G38_2221691 [Gigaspora rosea]